MELILIKKWRSPRGVMVDKDATINVARALGNDLLKTGVAELANVPVKFVKQWDRGARKPIAAGEERTLPNELARFLKDKKIVEWQQ